MDPINRSLCGTRQLRRGFRRPAGILRADHDVHLFPVPADADGDCLPVRKAGFSVDRDIRFILPEQFIDSVYHIMQLQTGSFRDGSFLDCLPSGTYADSSIPFYHKTEDRERQNGRHTGPAKNALPMTGGSGNSRTGPTVRKLYSRQLNCQG